MDGVVAGIWRYEDGEVKTEPFRAAPARRAKGARTRAVAWERSRVNAPTSTTSSRRGIGSRPTCGRRRSTAGPICVRAHAGLDVWVKHENHQPVGAFKVRGGVNPRLAAFGGRATARPHYRLHGKPRSVDRLRGQAVRRPGDDLRTVGANPLKVSAIEALGAEIVTEGRDFDEAREHCERLARHGYRYVHSGDEPHLIAGVATETLEILEEQPETDVVIVPVGGGSGVAGACIAARGMGGSARVIGVQSEAAPAACRAWKRRNRRG